MNKDTTLQDLLNLNLHKFEDDVHGIVDKAVKETSMEKTLREFGVTWANMAFIHHEHPRTKITLLIAEEEVIETLEDNQVSWVESCFLEYKILICFCCSSGLNECWIILLNMAFNRLWYTDIRLTMIYISCDL